MVVFGLLGLLRRFSSLPPPFKSCFSVQISVAMAIQCVSTTAPFSPLLESVVSANSVILIAITVKLMGSGKNNLGPRVVFIILSMGWCVFASILGVSLSKVEWRYEYRTFIFLLVMEENRLRILFKTALRIAEDMKLFEVQDCMFHMVLMEETHGVWNYMLSMEVKQEEGIFQFKRHKEITYYDIFIEGFFEMVALLRTFDFKEKGMRITKNLASKKLCDYTEENYRVKISHKNFGTEVLVPLCLYFRVTHIGFQVTVCKNKVQPNDAASKSYPRKANMKLDNDRSYDRLARKTTFRKASSISLLLDFSQCMAHTTAYVIICVPNYVFSVITI